MGGQAALPWTPIGTSSREPPAHEAQPRGPARSLAQIPRICPSSADRPTSAQGYLEVPEKPPGSPPTPTSSLSSVLDPPTQRPAPHKVSSSVGTPFVDPPPSQVHRMPQPSPLPRHPHLSENHQALGGGPCKAHVPARAVHIPCCRHNRLALPASPAQNIPGSPPAERSRVHRSEGSAFEFRNKNLKLMSASSTEPKESEQWILRVGDQAGEE